MADLTRRSTEEVIEDHLRCRTTEDLEGDLERNYAPDVVVLASSKAGEGHDFVRELDGILREHVPSNYEIPARHVKGPYACARAWQKRGRRRR